MGDRVQKTGAEQSGGAKPVIQFEAIVVEGRVQKPQAFYILQRSSLGASFQLDPLHQTFIPKIFQVVEKEPF